MNYRETPLYKAINNDLKFYNVIKLWKIRFDQMVKYRKHLAGRDHRLPTLKSLLVYKNITHTHRVLGRSKTFQQYWGVAKPKAVTTLSPQVDQALRDMTAQARKMDWRYRSAIEAHYAYLRNWFCIFDTLTIDPSSAPRSPDFFQTSVWQAYVVKVQFAVAKACYPDITFRERQKVRKQEYSRYLAVREGGEINPHIHILWFFKDVPNQWKTDPNNGRAIPDRRLCLPFKVYWDHGWSTPYYFRLSQTDAWYKAGHVWPVDSSGVPLRDTGPSGAGYYVSKYIGKERCQPGTRNRTIRASQKFGTRLMDLYRETLTQDQLEIMLTPDLKVLPPRRTETIRPSTQWSKYHLRKNILKLRIRSNLNMEISSLITAPRALTLLDKFTEGPPVTATDLHKLFQQLVCSADEPYCKEWFDFFDQISVPKGQLRNPIVKRT